MKAKEENKNDAKDRNTNERRYRHKLSTLRNIIDIRWEGWKHGQWRKYEIGIAKIGMWPLRESIELCI